MRSRRALEQRESGGARVARWSGAFAGWLCVALALAAVGHAQDREYLVGPKDVLAIAVFNQPELTGKFAVGTDGSITFPWIDRVKVAGLSTRGVEQALLARLSPAFIKNPQITVSVEEYLSQQFFVLGEVNSPGTFYLRGTETLIQALARAGSTKPDAGDEILVVRPRVPSAVTGPIHPEQIDDKDVRRVSMAKLSSGGLGENIDIQNGDTIFVPRAESVFILGQVKNPGPYRFSKSVTVLQFLSMAGGPTDRGAVNRVTIIRSVNGKKQEIKATLSDTVAPNDTIMVPEKYLLMHFPMSRPTIAAGPQNARPLDAPSSPPTLDRHLLDYVAVLVKRRWIPLITLAAALVLAAVSLYLSTPIYEATTQILIEHENQDKFSLEQGVAADRETTDYYNTQYTILQSRSLAARTLQQMGAWKSPELLGLAPQGKSIVSSVTGWVSSTFKGLRGAQAKRDEPAAPAQKATPAVSGTSETPAQSAMIDSFLLRLKIAPVKTSRLVDVKIEAANPKFAADAANALSKAYIDQNLEVRLASSQETSDWLAGQLSAQRDRIQASENALQQYRENHDAISLADRQSMISQKLAELNMMVTRAKGDRIIREASFNQARLVQQRAAPLDTLPAILSNSYLQQLKTDLEKLQAQFAQQSRDLGDQNPAMIALKSSVEAADAKLQRELAKQVEAMQNEYEAAKALEASLVQALEAQKREVTQMDRTGVDYSALEREVATNRQIFESLLARTREKGIAGELKASEIRIIDPAQVPQNPVWPNRRETMMYATFFGALLGIVLAFFVEYVDDRVKTPEEIKRYLGLPFLGLVPVVTAKEQESGRTQSLALALAETLPGRPLLHKRESVTPMFVEAFRAIRTNVIFAAEQRAPSIVVTSTGPGEGKTAVSTNLAIGLAMTGRSVLLLDVDMRCPQVHEVFGIDQKPGLSDVLVGTAKVEDACRKTSVPGLSVMPVGVKTGNPAELLSSPRFAQLLARLVGQFQWVIIDSPPVAAVTDSCIVANRASAVLFVVGAGRTRRAAAVAALEQLEKASATFVGAVLNGVHLRRSNPLYYSSHYRPAYEKYYTDTSPAASSDDLDAGTVGATPGVLDRPL